MPVISSFYGIIIFLYYLDNRKHHHPHFHAQYNEYEAIIDIDNGDILEGDLPTSKMKLVQAWLEIHKEQLKDDWQLAANGRKPSKIAPLI
jgi:hypothetical protein